MENLPNSERNLALERQEADTRFKELITELDAMPEKDQSYFDPDKKHYVSPPKVKANLDERTELRYKKNNIDSYIELAKPKEEQEYVAGDISNIEKMKIEKERVEKEIGEIKKVMVDTTNKINELRAKLGMPETDDIPSLIQKKEKLENLLAIQSDLESKLKFETKKQELQKEENYEDSKREGRNLDESSEDSKLEMKFLKASLEETANSLSSVFRELSERENQNMNHVFENPNLIRSSVRDFEFIKPDELFEKLPEVLKKLTAGLIFNYNKGNRGFSEDSESLRKLASKLGQLDSIIESLPSKIRNEEKKKEIGNAVRRLRDNLNDVIYRIKNKATLIEEI